MNEQLSKNILSEIEKRDLSPKPRWSFLFKRWVLWFIAGLASVLGGLAIAIIIYLFLDHDPEEYRQLAGSVTEDILMAIPYLWLALLGILVVIARYIIKQTKTGYRYSTLKIVLIVIAVSVLLGGIFDALDAGEQTQEFLEESVPYYDQLVYTSKDSWQQPDKGLLGGTIIGINSPTEFTLNDLSSHKWQVFIDEDEVSEFAQTIALDKVVKIVGEKESDNTFRVTQIFSWEK